MQSQEFDNLMLGKDAKWADMKKVKTLFADTVNKPNKAALLSAIRAHEEPIPAPTKADVDALIKKLRDNGMKESKIRRIVKNTFRITVV